MNKLSDDPQDYLTSREFVDADHPDVRAFSRQTVGDAPDHRQAAIRLYYRIRDEIIYKPYVDFSDSGTFRASTTLHRGYGFCVAKAALLAATAIAAGVPARVGFADVRNHLTSKRLLDLMGSDFFVWHGYADLYIDGKWLKATPTFDLSLCDKFGVMPLDFDGTADALFHAFDSGNRRHMEYINDRGRFADVPVTEIVTEFRDVYPDFYAACLKEDAGSLHDEASKT